MQLDLFTPLKNGPMAAAELEKAVSLHSDRLRPRRVFYETRQRAKPAECILGITPPSRLSRIRNVAIDCSLYDWCVGRGGAGRARSESLHPKRT
jgi:hypothetical protein